MGRRCRSSSITSPGPCIAWRRRGGRGPPSCFLARAVFIPSGRSIGSGYEEQSTRFVWTTEQNAPGFSAEGIAEDFALNGARSLYGATKLAAELLLQEYAYSYRMPVLVNRCALLAGPWQMGKVDQGVITLWVARHAYGLPLRYTGFGGQGKQVRDVLHIEDPLRPAGPAVCGLLVLGRQSVQRWRREGDFHFSFGIDGVVPRCHRPDGAGAAESATAPVDVPRTT